MGRKKVVDYVPIEGKFPPFDINVEKAIISAFLTPGRDTSEILELVRADDFYDWKCKTIFDAIVTLQSRGSPVDLTTIQAELNSNKKLQEVTTEYLINLVDSNPIIAPSVLYEYANILRDKSKLRQALRICQETQSKIYCEPIESAKDFLDNVEQEFFEIGRVYRGTGAMVAVSDMLEEAREQAEAAQDNKGGIAGISTGLTALDEIIGGLHFGDTMVVASRPGMGKSSLVLEVAATIADIGYGVLMLSLEMPRVQLGQRLIALDAKIDLSAIRSGKLPNSDWERYFKSLTSLKSRLNGRLWVDDSPALTALEVRAKIRRKATEAEKTTPHKKLGLVIVDYLQLMRVIGAQSRENEVGELSRAMKGFAKEFNTSIIVVSQLNRALELREDKRPTLSDLRDSGAIEQDADCVCFLYREDYYKGTSTGLCEAIIAKHRNGATGTAMIGFDAKSTRFYNIDT